MIKEHKVQYKIDFLTKVMEVTVTVSIILVYGVIAGAVGWAVLEAAKHA